MLGVPKGTSPSGVRGSVAAPGPSRQPRSCPALEPGDLGGGLRALGRGGGLAQEVNGSRAPREGGLRSQGLLPAVPLRERTQEHSLELQMNRINILPPLTCSSSFEKVFAWVGLGNLRGSGTAGLRTGNWGLMYPPGLLGCLPPAAPPLPGGRRGTEGSRS